MTRPLRMTHQREIILDELNRSKVHPTADELYERIRKKLPRISLATVYRNLEILSEAGLIKKLEISGRQKRFDWDPQPHNHVFCTQCHRVDDIPSPTRPVPPVGSMHDRGYQVTGYRIEFFGLCPKCQQTTDQSSKKGAEPMGSTSCAGAALSDQQRQVLEALAQAPEPRGSKEIAAATGLESKQISCQITALKNKGFVASPVRCQYTITDQGKDQLK